MQEGRKKMKSMADVVYDYMDWAEIEAVTFSEESSSTQHSGSEAGEGREFWFRLSFRGGAGRISARRTAN